MNVHRRLVRYIKVYAHDGMLCSIVKSEEVGYRSIPYHGVDVPSSAKSKMDKMCVVCTYSSKKVGS